MSVPEWGEEGIHVMGQPGAGSQKPSRVTQGSPRRNNPEQVPEPEQGEVGVHRL